MNENLLDCIKDESVAEGRLAFWWLGQMGWCVKTSNHTLYFDPYLTPREKRNFPPALAPESIDNADLILCTHDHIDHIDHPALPPMMQASGSASLLVPEVAIDELVGKDGISRDRIIAMRVGEVFEIAGCKVTVLKAKHEGFDYTEEFGFPYLQYIVEVDGHVIYHAGDTLIYDGMQSELSKWDIDIAFVPINGRDAIRFRRNCLGCMTWQEAADLCGELRPRLVCPGHWDMFSDNSENPYLFTDYYRVKYPGLNYWVSLPSDGSVL